MRKISSEIERSEGKSLHFAAAIKVQELILAAHQCKCAILH
jgi:hypothetical protein